MSANGEGRKVGRMEVMRREMKRGRPEREPSVHAMGDGWCAL